MGMDFLTTYLVSHKLIPPFAFYNAEVREHSTQEANQKQTISDRPLRMRGGGMAKDCLMAFVCFEVCKGCCECFADIICECPPYVVLVTRSEQRPPDCLHSR